MTFCGVHVLALQNKKQRQFVRESVLRSKDPSEVLEELERLEQLGESMELKCSW